MAKTKTVEKSKSVTRTTSSNSLEAMALEAKRLEDQERAKSASNNSFITLVQGNSGILLEDDARYIKGVKLHDYVITSKSLKLGPSFEGTVLGMFKLYEERTKPARKDEMGRTVNFWMPEDAEQIPLGKGENFARHLPNGNVLMPVHWVYLFLHKYPEIEDALLSFRSTGNRIYTELAKAIKAESALCTELRFTFTKQAIKNETYKQTYYYPKFELTGRNFTFKNGKVVPEKGVDKETLTTILTRSKERQEAYAGLRLVGRKTLMITASPAKPVMAGGYEEDEEDVHF